MGATESTAKAQSEEGRLESLFLPAEIAALKACYGRLQANEETATLSNLQERLHPHLPPLVFKPPTAAISATSGDPSASAIPHIAAEALENRFTLWHTFAAELASEIFPPSTAGGPSPASPPAALADGGQAGAGVSWLLLLRCLARHCKETLFADRVRLLLRVAGRTAEQHLRPGDGEGEGAPSPAQTPAPEQADSGQPQLTDRKAGALAAGGEEARVEEETLPAAAVAVLVLACWRMWWAAQRQPALPSASLSTAHRPYRGPSEPPLSSADVAAIQSLVSGILEATGRDSHQPAAWTPTHSTNTNHSAEDTATALAGAPSSPQTLSRGSSAAQAAAEGAVLLARLSPACPSRLPSTSLARHMATHLPGLVDRSPAFVLRRFTEEGEGGGENGREGRDQAQSSKEEAGAREGRRALEAAAEPGAPEAAGEAAEPGPSTAPGDSAAPDLAAAAAGGREAEAGGPGGAGGAGGRALLLSPAVAWLLEVSGAEGAAGSRAATAGVPASSSASAAEAVAGAPVTLPSSGAARGALSRWLGATLLYKSSVHGRGIRRFIAQAEGYAGPWLLLLALRPPPPPPSGGLEKETKGGHATGSVSSFPDPLVRLQLQQEQQEEASRAGRGSQGVAEDGGALATNGSDQPPAWLLAVLVGGDALRNSAEYYGDPRSSALLQLLPALGVCRATGREQAIIYTYAERAGAGTGKGGLGGSTSRYRSSSKPPVVGLGVGGKTGRERVFLDEDFSSATLRHHAVDKALQGGALFPGQGYEEVRAEVEEVEAWGLGGALAEERRKAYQQREELFAEQRRKIDLAKFVGKWEDAPEKQMLDMVSDPTRAQKEER